MIGGSTETAKMEASSDERQGPGSTQGRQVMGDRMETPLSLLLKPRGRPRFISVLKMGRRRTQGGLLMDQDEGLPFRMDL